MKDLQYKFNSKNRFKVKVCPCGKSNKDGKFVPFEDFSNFGYCHSCSKTFNPSTQSSLEYIDKPTIKKCSQIQYIPSNFLAKSLKRNRVNNFISFLIENFGSEVTDRLIEQYKIGNSKQWYGANVFWYLDTDSKVRTGKIMLYNKLTCKRVSEPYNHINWVHSKLKIPNDSISKCLFGEHLLNLHPNKPIAIVESEKTSIIASIFFPSFIWMATGGISNLTYDRIKVLKGRGIVLFPDLGAYNLWLEKAQYFSTWFNITVSDYLEINAIDVDKKLKYDLADYLLKFNIEKFN